MYSSEPYTRLLSYAREDADAAQRICDALCAAGVQVWFDRNELVGGDAWDQKIRRQIKECALFVPIISAHTQARLEGYFRLEWKLAEDRTHLMAKGRTFLLPVVVDDTRDSEAVVPEAFVTVQWTRLPGGETPRDFCIAVQDFLESFHPAQPADCSNAGHKPARLDDACMARRPHATANAGLAPSPAWLNVSPAKPQAIAVLPFANLSPDPENAFFTDGIHEDILTTLSNIRELRVISRTSVMQYRETTKPARQIARELGVTFLLEGSVRRGGNKVRVTGQLIRANEDEQVWARSYDRELVDIFTIQAELANEIAAALRATLSAEEKTLIGRRLTVHPAAYDLYLKARDAKQRAASFLDEDGTGADRGALDRDATLLQAAVALDPEFAEAWAELATRHALLHFHNYDRSEARRKRAKDAIDAAVRLAPESPDVIRNVANYHLYAFRDYTPAIAHVETLVRLRPNDPEIVSLRGDIQRRQGRWRESLESFRAAAQLEPGNAVYAQRLARHLFMGRRWEEAIAAQARVVALLPDSLQEANNLAELHFHATGSTKEVNALFASLTPAQAATDEAIALRKWWLIESGNWAEGIKLEQEHPVKDADLANQWYIVCGVALALMALGDTAAGQAMIAQRLTGWRQRLEAEPDNTKALCFVGFVEALLGREAEALRYAELARQSIPPWLDAVAGPVVSNRMALLYAWVGKTELALVEVERQLQTPNSVADVHMMRVDPWWFPLRGDPRFEALLNDPKNNAPLF